jgi:hypothetical protein
METMKLDMATVLGVMQVIAQLKPQCMRYVPATENMPSGTAQRPGDGSVTATAKLWRCPTPMSKVATLADALAGETG